MLLSNDAPYGEPHKGTYGPGGTMRVATRAVILSAVARLSLFALSGVASASNPVGSAKWCANHPHSKLAACKSGGGGTERQ
jgi:hypothetical protein